MFKKLLALEPVLSAGSVQAVLALVLSFGVHLSAAATGAVEAVAAALLGLIVAAQVKPVAPSAMLGLLSAVGTLLIAYKVPHITGGSVSAFSGFMAILLPSILRLHVTPVAAPKPARAAAPRPPAPAPPSTPAAA